MDQQAIDVFGQQGIPIGAPDHLDDIPTGTAERAFQFLDDLSVSANWSVETLQIAVDDEDQVVELFAAGQGDSAQGFGLIAFPVAQECPNARGFGVGLDAAIDQIVIKPSLVDRHERPQAHRYRGKFPKVGH